jgi:hypothetical protein
VRKSQRRFVENPESGEGQKGQRPREAEQVTLEITSNSFLPCINLERKIA